MNNFSELLFNPVTIIALILACFFSMMAFFRSQQARRKEKEKNAAKPYTVADPFSQPQAAPVHHPLPPPTLSAHPPAAQLSDGDQSHKYFRQFGSTPNGTGAVTPSNTAGYIWE